MTRLSLAMIAKNEEKKLPECLKSVKGEVDQIVVVDTGSNDSTKEIAKEYGAEVYEYEWQDDFAAARNNVLNYVQGDWILQMDADHRLINKSDLSLSEQLKDIEELGLMINEKTILNNGGQHNLDRLLLFQNIPGLKYRGVLHENPYKFLKNFAQSNNIDNWLKTYKKVEMEHFSYEDPKSKLQRNLRVLKKGLENEPQNSQYRYNLLMTLKGLDKNQEYENKLKQYSTEILSKNNNFLYSEIGILGLFGEYIHEDNIEIDQQYIKKVDKIGKQINWNDIRMALPYARLVYERGNNTRAIEILRSSMKNGLKNTKIPINKDKKYELIVELIKIYSENKKEEEIGNLLINMDKYIEGIDMSTKKVLEYIAQMDMDLFKNIYQIMEAKTGG